MFVRSSARALARTSILAGLVVGALAVTGRAGSRPEVDIHPTGPTEDPMVPGGVAPGVGGFSSACVTIRRCPGQSSCDPNEDGLPTQCDRCTFILLDEKACRFTFSFPSFCNDTSSGVVTCGPYWRGLCMTAQEPGQPVRRYCSYVDNPRTECRRSMCAGN